jgi:hypothetical protein
MRMDVLLEMIASLPFEASMTYLGPLAAGLHHARHETRLHLRLAEQVFGQGPMLDLIRRFVVAGPDRLVFDERYLAALQRLLVEHAQPDPDGSITAHERAKLLTCLLGIGDALPDWSPPEPTANGEYDVSAWMTYTVQRGAYYNAPYVLEAIARTTTMLVDIANEPDLAPHRALCPLEDWAAEDAGSASLTDQVAQGVALAIGSRALDPAATLAERLTQIEPGYMRQTALSDREEAIFDAISADHDRLRAMFAGAGSGPEHLAWDHTPFEQRPFLRRSDSSLILISPSALVSWLGRGLYFRMLDAANARTHPTNARRRRGPDFLQFTGALGERFALRLIERSHQDKIRAREVVVSGEQPYGEGAWERRSPDIAVAQAPNLVLFEVFSGRIPRVARIGGAPLDIEKALSKMILEKLEQLQRRIADMLNEDVAIPGVPNGQPIQIWPVILLTGDGVLQTPILWKWIRDRLPDGAFRDDRVRRPTICDLDDLDPLLVLVERGTTLPALLESFHSSEHAEFSPRNWVSSTQGLFEHERPAYVHQQFERTMREVHQRLFPGSSSLARQGASSEQQYCGEQ